MRLSMVGLNLLPIVTLLLAATVTGLLTAMWRWMGVMIGVSPGVAALAVMAITFAVSDKRNFPETSAGIVLFCGWLGGAWLIGGTVGAAAGWLVRALAPPA